EGGVGLQHDVALNIDQLAGLIGAAGVVDGFHTGPGEEDPALDQARPEIIDGEFHGCSTPITRPGFRSNRWHAGRTAAGGTGVSVSDRVPGSWSLRSI